MQCSKFQCQVRAFSLCSLSLSSSHVQMEQQEAQDIMDELRHIYMYVVKVKSAPCAGKFSSMPGCIVYDTVQGRVPLGAVMDISHDTLTGKGNNRDRSIALRRLIRALNNDDNVSALVTSLSEALTERMQFLALAKYFLDGLTPSVVLNALSYSAKTMREAGAHIATGYLGMGSSITWHGTPDGRADWAPLQSVSHIHDDSDSDSEASSGGKTTCEAKKTFSPSELDQLMAQAVVSSYVHYNRHPEQNPLVPALGFSCMDGLLLAVVYDCTTDTMLQLLPLPWIDMPKRRLVQHGVVVMWLLLHHRLFLKQLPTGSLPRAGLTDIFERSGALLDYTRLRDYHVINWPQRGWLNVHSTTAVPTFMVSPTGADEADQEDVPRRK